MKLKISQVLAFCLVISILVLSGCSTSRYSLRDDVGPTGDFDASKVPDAIPRWEPLSRKGNKSPYWVRGKKYRLLKQAEGYVEEGIASWYGLKFHGELTSNGEVYNIYDMTAAHKALPLPSFLRVTNLENQKTVVVRVNDRGPFHSDRVIDLSYAAAKKLGYAEKGTTRVKLEVITSKREEGVGDGRGMRDRLAYFIQVAAFSDLRSAESLVERLSKNNEFLGVFIAPSGKSDKKVHRVRIGPIDDEVQADKLLLKVKSSGAGRPILIRRPISAKGS